MKHGRSRSIAVAVFHELLAVTEARMLLRSMKRLFAGGIRPRERKNGVVSDWMAERVDGGKIPTNCSRIVSKATPHVDAEFPALSIHTKPFGTVPTARTAFMQEIASVSTALSD